MVMHPPTYCLNHHIRCTAWLMCCHLPAAQTSVCATVELYKAPPQFSQISTTTVQSTEGYVLHSTLYRVQALPRPAGSPGVAGQNPCLSAPFPLPSVPFPLPSPWSLSFPFLTLQLSQAESHTHLSAVSVSFSLKLMVSTPGSFSLACSSLYGTSSISMTRLAPRCWAQCAARMPTAAMHNRQQVQLS